MKLFGEYSIPPSVQIHARSVVPPSIKRYDGAYTTPVSLATDMRLEGEGASSNWRWMLSIRRRGVTRILLIEVSYQDITLQQQRYLA